MAWPSFGLKETGNRRKRGAAGKERAREKLKKHVEEGELTIQEKRR